MPAAIPLVGAAFSIGAGITAGVTTLVGGLMVAGGALTAVGTLTGNSKLQKIGGVMSLVGGGIGAFESLTSAASSVAPSASSGVSSAVDTATSAASQAATEAASQGAQAAAASQAAEVAATQAAAQNPGLLQSAMGEFAPTATQYGAFGEAPLGQALAQNQGVISQAATNPLLTTQEAIAASAPGASAGSPALNMAEFQQMAPTATQYGAFGEAPLNPPAPKSWWDGFTDKAQRAGQWIEQNPKTAQVLGQAVQGAASYYGPLAAAEEQQKRAMAYQDWVRQRYSDSVRNLRVPRLTQQAPATAGIIGGARG